MTVDFHKVHLINRKYQGIPSLEELKMNKC